ncbi:MAG: hypothetical protein HYV47_01470 [Candidatus Nealsonbacteria bacterium]|nr:hypothetical protein [Candidatus Nealsonbacteria bacterium]
MILSAHLLAGAVIASKISNPILALPLALLSHYFLDLLPQTEYSISNIKAKRWSKSLLDWSKVFLDISFGILLIYLFSDKSPLIFIGAIPAIIPDGMTLVYILFPGKKLIKLHHKFHQTVNNVYDTETKRKPALWGIFMQIIIALIAIFLL